MNSSVKSQKLRVTSCARNRARGGFTLIELLVVVAIIGLLASVVFASLTTARARGRDARRVSDLREMQKVIVLIDADPAVSFAGCAAADAKVNTCTIPNLAGYADPSSGTAGTACVSGGTAVCQYAVSKQDGSAGNPTTQDYQICSYLETGSGSLAAGMVRITSNGGIVSGCN